MLELYYECPDCGEQWTDTYASVVDSDCPVCECQDIEPYEVDDA